MARITQGAQVAVEVGTLLVKINRDAVTDVITFTIQEVPPPHKTAEGEVTIKELTEIWQVIGEYLRLDKALREIDQ